MESTQACFIFCRALVTFGALGSLKQDQEDVSQVKELREIKSSQKEKS